MDAEQSNVMFPGDQQAAVEAALVQALPQFRWFSGKARSIRATRILDAVPVGSAGWLALARVGYEQGPEETFVLPLAVAHGTAAEQIAAEPQGRLVIRLSASADSPAILYDPLADEAFARALLQMIADGETANGSSGQLIGWAGKQFTALRGDPRSPLDIKLVKSEQSNSSIIYGGRLILKLFRRLEDGPNPELEIGAYLTERAGFTHIAPLAGAIEYRRPGQSAGAVAVLQGFVPNQGDAWTHLLQRLDAMFKHCIASAKQFPFDRLTTRRLLESQRGRDDEGVMGLSEAALLGQRTGELHMALAAATNDPELDAEPLTPENLRRLCDDGINLTGQALDLLADKQASLPAPIAVDVSRLLAARRALIDRFARWERTRFAALRIRCHGDYHLGQVLFTGDDFVILDFEGEPARSLAERRAKHSPLKDVAGMLRSFDYAVHVALNKCPTQHPKVHKTELTAWGNFWYVGYTTEFLKTYQGVVGAVSLLPKSLDDVAALLDMYLLEKAIYELKYELNNRPDWVAIPLAAILQIVDAPATC